MTLSFADDQRRTFAKFFVTSPWDKISIYLIVPSKSKNVKPLCTDDNICMYIQTIIYVCMCVRACEQY